MYLQEHTLINSHTLHTLRIALMCVLLGLGLLIPSVARSENTITSMVPVGDSVALKTTVYKQSEPGRFPAVLIRTPYRGDWLAIAAQRFADRGYVAVVQSVRGMNESQEQFIPFVNEHSDGLATVDWIASQAWSDGQVALWGASYLSHCAFEIARSNHPALKAMVNISGWAELTPFLTRGGALRLLDQLPWLMEYAGGQSQIPDQAWEGMFRSTPLSNFFGGT